MKISVPDLGDFADVEIIEVLVEVGDRIEAEDPIVTLETDKATMDVPSPAAGVVSEIQVAVGDRVSTGDPLIVIEGDAGGGDQSPAGKRAAGSAVAAPAEAETAAAGGPAEAAAPADRPQAAAADAGPAPEQPVTVPDLGDFADVEIIDILVDEGDEVEAEQGLITLETEKATMDVPATEAGTIVSIKVKTGDRVSSGDEIMTLRPRAPADGTGPEAAEAAAKAAAGAKAGAEGAAQAAEAAAAQVSRSASERSHAAAAAQPQSAQARPGAATRLARGPQGLPIVSTRVDEAGFALVHASPSVRKLARELGVDLARVQGTGRKHRVTADNVKAFVKELMRTGGGAGGGLPAVPEVDFAKFGPVEREPLGRIQRISGARVHASWVNIPHVTQHDEADITALEEARNGLKGQAEQRGIRLTPLAFILRACALTLAEFPRFAASLSPDGQNLILKHYMHIGFAADTPNGLVVPVIRDADKKDIFELAADLGMLSARAREGKLKTEDIQGGVFTVSSLGGIGGTAFTPIVNAPEVAILGVSRSQWRPVYRDGGFIPRLMLPLSLSYDHRVIDGAAGVRFTTRLAETLEQTERLLEAVP